MKVGPLPAHLQELFDAAVKRDLRKPVIRPPKIKFTAMSEKQRQQAAIDRANGF